jgi:polyferredoxin
MATLVQIADPPAVRKKLVRRAKPDRSQIIRQTMQWAFFALNIWIGIQFYAFVRYYESGGIGRRISRPPGVEGWLPIASLMNLKYFAVTGRFPSVLCAGMVLLCVFLALSLILRKSFCSWLCPVGTISEMLWRVGKKLIGRNFALPRWLDLPLRSLKYLLMAFFLFAVATMSAGAIEQFLAGPYGAMADVQMLNFFRHLSSTAAAVLIVLVTLSFFIQNFWCRYLCPYGALMGIAALFSPARIQRSTSACIDCAKCSRACPAQLPVDQLVTIYSAECTACMECVAICPAEGALSLNLPRRRSISPWAVAATIAVLFFGAVLYARISGHWWPALPESIYMELIPHAEKVLHP